MDNLLIGIALLWSGQAQLQVGASTMHGWQGPTAMHANLGYPVLRTLSSRSKSTSSKPSAMAKRAMLSMEMFRSARSTDPMYVRCSPA